MNAINARGLKVPTDISVAGYDGLKIARHFEPQLTTIRQDTAKLGSEAAEKLISLIEHPRTTLTEQITVEGTVFEGGSVARINR